MPVIINQLNVRSARGQNSKCKLLSTFVKAPARLPSATSCCVFLSVDAGCSALEFDDRNEGCTAGDISAGKTRWYKCMKSACVAEAFVGVTGGLFSELERLFARVCTFVKGNL